jgi:hypothetical protein
MNDTEKMRHRPTRGGTEVDAFSNLHTAHRWNHGRRSLVKTGYTRRTRRTANQRIRAGRI